MAGACPDSDGSYDFSRLNQAFLTPFAGAGGWGGKLVVRASLWHPRRSVKLPEEGGRRWRERKEGFERGERERIRRREKLENFKAFSLSRVLSKHPNCSFRFNPEKILLVYEIKSYKKQFYKYLIHKKKRSYIA